MQTVKITTPQNIDIDYEIAGIGERILARLIDGAFFVIIIVLGLIIAALTRSFNSTVVIIVLLVIYAILFVFYDLICEITMNGQSLGKRVMKIKVISLDGARPSFGQYLLRWLFRIVDFSLTSDLCALICVAASDKKQRVGDMVAGTTLIKTEPRTSINNLVFTPMDDNYVPVFKEVTQLNDHDITLIQEVIRNYFNNGNTEVVYNAAVRVTEILSVDVPKEMDGLQFLQTVVKDYSHIVAANDQLINS
ncbi:MAG TPA: RDD family protein [Mucilaginibacter sp.]|jgi:uncharacterized RDD family membrane protein YckC